MDKNTGIYKILKDKDNRSNHAIDLNILKSTLKSSSLFLRVNKK